MSDDSFESTIQMLESTFPGGIPDSMVLPVTRALYEYMSHRNLAEVLSKMTGMETEVALNTVYEAAGLDPNTSSVRMAKERLRMHGYDQWCDED